MNDFDERDCWDDDKPVALPSWPLWAILLLSVGGAVMWFYIVKWIVGWFS